MTQLASTELLKLRTTRAPYALLLAILLISALTVVGWILARIAEGDQRALALADAAEASSILATLVGVLLVTNEYRHGTIASTFLATPARERIVAAKVLAGLVVGIVAGAAASLVSLAIAVPWLSSRGEPLELGWPLLDAQLRLVGVFVLSTLVGVGLGLLIRSQIGAIVTTFVWFLVAEPLIGVIGAALTGFDRDPVAPYLPGAAIDALVSTGGASIVDPQWLALPLALAYVAALGVAGLVVTLRRDAV